MKKITKTEEPGFYMNFIKKEKPQKWDDISPVRTQMRMHILEIEQNHQCAYTSLQLRGNNDDSHIDHYKKQNMFPSEILNYNNLFVSTNNEAFGAKYKDKHITKPDYDFLINPALENPDDYLEYSYSGEIYSKNNSKKGEKTIELFQLNHKFLKKKRKDKIKIFNTIKNEFDLDELITYLREFEGMIRYFYNEK
ncbi:hypothetical protein FACS189455_2530 [Bacteroidia bacterium]|nr:hypothetical protein FACS189455_2530 [Bacteroidia bacterium]